MTPTKERVYTAPRTALRDRPVPQCPRCGFVTRGWPLTTVGDTYAGCPACGKLFNR